MADRATIQIILQKLWQLEKDSSLLHSPQFLSAVIKEIESLASSPHDEVKRLSQWSQHFHSKMDPQTLPYFIIPFERHLQREAVDPDFLPDEGDLESPQEETLPLVLVLDNIRSSFNSGSLLRTSECLRLEHVYFCGYTATPENQKTSKAAMGTANYQNWSHFTKVEDCIEELNQQGYHLIALETSPQALAWDSPLQCKTKTALILGNERYGVSPHILSLCHEIRRLPARGRKNSLNVANAGAIMMYEWYRQWK